MVLYINDVHVQAVVEVAVILLPAWAEVVTPQPWGRVEHNGAVLPRDDEDVYAYTYNNAFSFVPWLIN